MKNTLIFLILLGLIFMLAIGCETQNPVCSENYCVMGEIFPRSEIGDSEFEELPVSVDEETLVGLLAGKSQEAAPPRVTGGTVKNGDFHVNAEVINSAGKIEVIFSEQVRGHIALQTIGGDDVGWRGRVEGNKGVLELLRGKEIDNGTLYVIISIVRDAVGNEAEIKTLFQTKGVKRSVVDKPVVEEPKVSFKEDILPLFRERCQQCHRQRARKDPEARLDLSSYKGTMRGSRNGKVIDPGWGKASPIFWRISVDQIGTRMPPWGDRLSAEQIQLIIDWINQGAKDN